MTPKQYAFVVEMTIGEVIATTKKMIAESVANGGTPYVKVKVRGALLKESCEKYGMNYDYIQKIYFHNRKN